MLTRSRWRARLSRHPQGKTGDCPGAMNKFAVIMGKLLPFPLAIRVMELIYNQSVEPVPPPTLCSLRGRTARAYLGYVKF